MPRDPDKGQKVTRQPGRGPVWPPPPPPPPANYSRCASGVHRLHPDMSCEDVGDRPWDPLIGYYTEAEAAAHPPQFTGIAHLAAKES